MTNDAEFDVTVSDQAGTPVLHARGEIDVASAPEFHAALSDMIGRGAEVVIVDMEEVSFIDSTGLGVLVAAEKEMRHAGHDLRLVITQPQITRLLELTGLDKVFTVLPGTDHAVAP